MSTTTKISPRIFKTTKFIADNKIIFPKHVSKITTIFYKYGGKKNTICRDFIRKQYPSIQHYNSQLKCDTLKYQQTSENARIIIELDDGSQQVIRVDKNDNEEILTQRIQKSIQELTEKEYQPEAAIFIKDFYKQVELQKIKQE